MRHKLFFFITAIALLVFSAAKPRPAYIFMAGDSTMADKVLVRSVIDSVTGEKLYEQHLERGWGMYVQQFFGDRVSVRNIAKNGRSSRTFIAEGLWKRITDNLQKGDYVVIQFGHNDDVPTKKSATTPDEFRRYISQYVDETRAKGATPVLCTPVVRRNFQNGILTDTHGVYPDVIRNVAKDKKVILIDLEKQTREWISAEGEPATRKYFHKFRAGESRLFPKGLDDNTHFVELGARKVAQMFVDELKTQKITELTSLLKENEKPYKSEVWVADLGNGQYKNPVLYADYSDPDACRAGEDFYMTASSFSNTPALPILHSRDLVNWTLVSYAQPALDERFAVPHHGDGVWAPSIRYYEGEFYIYYGDPDVGIFMTKTKDVRGKWSPLTLVKAGKGLIDACPLWDEDGRVYLVHGFAGSRATMKSVIAVCELSPDGTKAITEDRIVFDGHNAHPTVEGAKFYKRNGYYYIFAPAGGVKPGWQLAMRAENVYGPYTEKTVLAQGKTDINGPHQGAWVTSPDGKEDWFVHFQDLYAYGRVVHLQPMAWKNDFPVIGDDRDGDGCGEPVLKYRKPNFAKNQTITTPVESDEFDNSELGLQWQWQANANPLWYYLNYNESYIRLFAWESATDNLWGAANLLMQKFPAPDFKATTKMTFSPYKNGERAGLAVMGMDYAAIVIEKTADGLEIRQITCKNADAGKPEAINATVKAASETVYFRVEVKQSVSQNREKIKQPHAHCIFYYSTDGKTFTKLGQEFEAREGKWIGAKVGVFCQRPASLNDSGYADVDWVRIE